MNKNYIYIIILTCCFSLLSSMQLHAAVHAPISVVSTDSLTTKASDTTKLKKADAQQIAHLKQLATLRSSSLVTGSTIFNTPSADEVTVVEEKVFRSFPSLDDKLKESQNFNISFGNRTPEFNEAYLAENYQPDPAVEKLINNAKGALNAVAALGNFVDIITGNELLELPVGLKKTDQTSNNSVELAITEVKFTPGYALLKVWARLTIPEKGELIEDKDGKKVERTVDRELFFGAENVKLSYDGGLSGDMKLVLLGDTAIPMQGDNWLLTLKGGIDLTANTFNDKSFIEFDCSDLKAISLEGDIRVSRNVLLPIDELGEYICGADTDNVYTMSEVIKNKEVVDNKCYVGTSFKVSADGWNDIFLTVDLPPFEVVGLQGWGFHMSNVTMDFSDLQSYEDMVMPTSYDRKYPGTDRKLWRGFYAEEITVKLPKGIENTSTSKRVEFSAQHLLLDSQGVSGTFSAENVLQAGEGSAGKWAFTIEDVSISLDSNSLTGGSIGGDIAVPIFEDPMDYDGYISQGGYGLQVGLQSSYTTPMFLGEMQLADNSSVAINVENGNVYPYANLTGSLAIAGKVNQEAGQEPDPDDPNGFSFTGITFQALEIQTEPGTQPIQAEYFGFEGEMELMNFPVSINNLALITPNNMAGLSFDLSINLDDSGSHATTSLDVLGKLDEDAQIQEWKFERVKVDGIEINYTKSNFTLEGSLAIMEDDPVYGDGFDGTLSATFENPKFKVGGRAIFGKTDFRYWIVDVWTDNVEENGNSKLPLKAFVGGISNRMRKTGGNASGFQPGTATYIPDANTGLGIRAGVKIETQNAKSFSCKAYLEMEYNIHGGLNRIGFMGEGSVMGSGDTGNLAETGAAATKVGQALEDNSNLVADQSNGNYLTVAEESIPVTDVAASGKVGVYVGIERDFTNDTFEGEFKLYLDLAAVKGGGEDNLAGYAKIYTSPDEWYMYLGTPQIPIELIFNAGAQIRVGGYFMTGTKLPSQLDPHPNVVKILGRDMLNGERKDNQLTAGRGFAFGLNFSYGYAFDWTLFYASVELGAGFDVMHAYYPDAKCVGRPGPIGNNGWYSMGQVYAYLYGEFGVDVDLAFIKGKFKIAEAGVAANLRGQFPNPVYIQGYVGMYYNILGGLVKGRMRMKVEVGEECELEGISNTIGVPMISDLTPHDNTDDASVFSAPQAVFNYAVNSDFTVDLEGGTRTFKLQLTNFSVTSEGQAIDGELEWNDTNDAVTFKPTETLPSEKEVTAVVEVSFDEKINGSYQTMTEDGQPVVERVESSFVTDEAPDHIVWGNVDYVYPVREQQNFYPREYNKGYIKMGQGQNYLFDSGYEMRAEFVPNYGEGIRSTVQYDRANATVFYDIPPDLDLNTDYTLNLVVYPPGAEIQTEIVIEETNVLSDEESGDTDWYNPVTDTQETINTSASAVVSNKKAANVTVSNGAPKSIFDYEFKTSIHETFGDKVNALHITNNLTNYIYADVHSLSIQVDTYEYLDIPEVMGNQFTGGMPLVFAEAILTDSYYKNQIYPLLYEKYPLDGNIVVDRDEQILGVPPIRSFQIANEYLLNLTDNPNSHWVKNRIPFIYNLPLQYKADFIYLRGQIVNRYSNTDGDSSIYESFQYLTEQLFPAIPLGKYKSQLIYRTPGNLHQQGHDLKYKKD